MLYLLYSLTKEFPELLEFLRRLILQFEIPLLKWIFRLAGATEVLPRHSINEPAHFNIFMSDLDFTIVSEKERFDFLVSVRSVLKKVFLNLGEIELYSKQEYLRLRLLEESPFYSFWERIFLVRKLGWQRKKLASSSDRYQKEKHQRAITISLKRLQSKENLDIIKIFPELASFNEATISLPYFSVYLEHFILPFPATRSISCGNSQIASTFISLLPDNDITPRDLKLREIKALLLQKEILTNLASMRLKQPDRVSRKWERDIEDRFHQLLKADRPSQR